MKLSNSFRIDRPPAEVFDAFLDVERIATCMPGSRLTGKPAEDTYDGEVKIKVGPLGVSYAGQLKLVDASREELKLTIRATGHEQHGAGNADARVIAQLKESDGGTAVEIVTDLSIRGKVAQFGHGVIGQVTDSIIQQFAVNVEAMLNGEGDPAQPRAAAGAAPSRHQETPASSTVGADASLDGWALIVRPLIQRHSQTVLPIATAGIAAYVGARIGSRRRTRRPRPRQFD